MLCSEAAGELDAHRERLGAASISLLRFDELGASGEQPGGDSSLPLLASTPPSPDDYAFIMYTSGTTGVPKGAPQTHSGFVATVTGLNERVPVHPGDVHISYPSDSRTRDLLASRAQPAEHLPHMDMASS